jgi:hypothetical protein
MVPSTVTRKFVGVFVRFRAPLQSLLEMVDRKVVPRKMGVFFQLYTV